MATRFIEDGDTDGKRTGPPSDDEHDEVAELLVALADQIARTQALIGRTGRLVEEIDEHRKTGPKFRVPPR